MKRTIVSAVAVLAFSGAALITAFSGFPTTAQAQNSGQKELEHKIGLIDMAEVFKEYKKFKALREDLKVDIQASDRKAKVLAAQAKTIADQLKSGTFKEGSQEYKRLEDELIRMRTEFNSFKARVQRDFMRQESQIYKTVYLEVADATKKYAEYFKYTLVLRFNRKSISEAAGPKGILGSMNKQVIYSRPEDDITDSVVDYLNKLYNRAQGSASAKKSKKTSTN